MKEDTKKKMEAVINLVANNYGGMIEFDKLFNDPSISEEDIKNYIAYCDKAPKENVKNVDCWKKFEQMKYLARTCGLGKIAFRKDVAGFTKYTVDYGMGDAIDCIRVITDYGSFGISKTGVVVNC